MTALLLSVHVLAAVIAVGPVAVAGSMFPPAAHAGSAAPLAGPVADVRTLHRICRTYAAVGLAVPVFGLATGAALGVLGDVWVLASVALTVGAAGVLVAGILPLQRRLLPERAVDDADPAAAARHLSLLTGIFNLLWAVVVVLMIVRPGSTTRVS